MTDNFKVKRKLTWGYLQNSLDGFSQGGLSCQVRLETIHLSLGSVEGAAMVHT